MTGKGTTDLTARVAASHRMTDIDGLQLKKCKRSANKVTNSVGGQMPTRLGIQPAGGLQAQEHLQAAQTSLQMMGPTQRFNFHGVPPESMPLAMALHAHFTGLRQTQLPTPPPSWRVFDDPRGEMETPMVPATARRVRRFSESGEEAHSAWVPVDQLQGPVGGMTDPGPGGVGETDDAWLDEMLRGDFS